MQCNHFIVAAKFVCTLDCVIVMATTIMHCLIYHAPTSVIYISKYLMCSFTPPLSHFLYVAFESSSYFNAIISACASTYQKSV